MDEQPKPVWLGDVPLSDIRPNNHNPNLMTDAEFAGLCENIKNFGFRDPILVRPDATKQAKYEIVDGEHRWRACQENKLSSIPCYLQPLADAAAKLSTLSQNLIHGTHDPIQQANLIVDIQRDIAPSEIMANIGVRPVEYVDMLGVLDAPGAAPVVADGEDEPPVNITLTLLASDHLTYEQALERAYGAAPDENTVILVGENVATYDAAMQRSLKLLRINKRGEAFARICQAFMTVTDDQLLELFPPPEKPTKQDH